MASDSDENSGLRAIASYLWNRSLGVCVIYRIHRTLKDVELKTIRVSASKNTTEDAALQAAENYKAVARYGIERKKDLALRAVSSDSTNAVQACCGISKLPDGEPFTVTLNAEGRGWWEIVVCTGHASKANLVLVASVGAKDLREASEYIRDIRDIFGTIKTPDAH